MSQKKSVGVRELRQNLSVYLRRVKQGVLLEVTERGRPVAILAPLPEPATALDRLVASGRASAPAGDLLDLRPLRSRGLSRRLKQVLDDIRAERL
ncbi:MAG TPA: type II toxin-antitoxin system prevent-host-death family antitoxin [Acidobacteriota bacterium]|jgi:prevent-host-death family protein|nr:type II toxin-antitoxin system prevent-host-death family antitoxin [Acidobacteriota bacterium]